MLPCRLQECSLQSVLLAQTRRTQVIALSPTVPDVLIDDGRAEMQPTGRLIQAFQSDTHPAFVCSVTPFGVHVKLPKSSSNQPSSPALNTLPFSSTDEHIASTDDIRTSQSQFPEAPLEAQPQNNPRKSQIGSHRAASERTMSAQQPGFIGRALDSDNKADC